MSDSRELHDGDLLQFGGEHCQWFFRLPMSGSATAVLEQARPGGASVQNPDGSQFRRVVLMDDYVVIRSRPAAHVILPSLPADELTLRWTENGLAAEAEGGALAVETSDHDCDDAGRLLFLPSQLLIRSELDEAELLGRAVAGNEVPDELRLTIRDPFHGRQRKNG